MSDGGLGQGLSYWATITIRGDLDKAQLQKVVKQIKRILGDQVDGKAVNGEIVHATRASNVAPPDFSIDINKK